MPDALFGPACWRNFASWGCLVWVELEDTYTHTHTHTHTHTCTLPYLERITNKSLLYSTGNSVNTAFLFFQGNSRSKEIIFGTREKSPFQFCRENAQVQECLLQAQLHLKTPSIFLSLPGDQSSVLEGLPRGRAWPPGDPGAGPGDGGSPPSPALKQTCCPPSPKFRSQCGPEQAICDHLLDWKHVWILLRFLRKFSDSGGQVWKSPRLALRTSLVGKSPAS